LEFSDELSVYPLVPMIEEFSALARRPPEPEKLIASPTDVAGFV
jgi:hypothetical protein